MISFTINEDFYFPCLTGLIDIQDSIGMFDQFPISGNEKLTVKFYSWDYDTNNRTVDFIHRTFSILKITNIKQVNDYTKTYTLYFASPELKMNETIKVSKSYQNCSISKVIAELLTDEYDPKDSEPIGLSLPKTDLAQPVVKSLFLNPDGNLSENIELLAQKVDEQDSIEIFVEKTKYIEPFITIPYAKPFEIINQLASRSIRLCGGRNNTSEETTVCNFLFFENKRGYQYVSLDTLLENKNPNIPMPVFHFANAAQNMTDANGGRTVNRGVIESFQWLNCHDVLQNINNGMYASRLITYDMSNGETYTSDYDYNKEFYNTESTERTDLENDYPMVYLDKQDSNSDLTNKPFSRYMMMPTIIRGIDLSTSGFSQRINDLKELVGTQEYLQKRASQLSRLENIKVVIQISGNSQHKVGDLVELDLKYLPLFDGNAKSREKAIKYYSGIYIITSIKHSVSLFEYKMTIELAKDSFKEKIGELSDSTKVVDTKL